MLFVWFTLVPTRWKTFSTIVLPYPVSAAQFVSICWKMSRFLHFQTTISLTSFRNNHEGLCKTKYSQHVRWLLSSSQCTNKVRMWRQTMINFGDTDKNATLIPYSSSGSSLDIHPIDTPLAIIARVHTKRWPVTLNTPKLPMCSTHISFWYVICLLSTVVVASFHALI